MFVPDKPFGSLLEISAINHIFLKAFNSGFQDIVVQFTDQNSHPLEVEDRTNLMLVITQKIYYKMRYSIFNLRIEYMQKDMDFCLLLKTWVKM